MAGASRSHHPEGRAKTRALAPGRFTSNRSFVVAVMMAVALVGVLQVFTHEPWRDEWQAWLIARESKSLPDLIANLRYEGHPPLWHIALFAISRVTRDIRAMQVLHLLIGLASTGLVVAKAPFSRLARATYAFGYFPLFEYLAISRQYSLGVLLAVSYACLSWRQTPGPSWLRVLVLIGLSLTSVQGLIVAAGLVMGALASRRDRPERPAALTTVPLLAAAAVLLIPPGDSGVRYPWVLGFDRTRLTDAVIALARPLVPIPRLARKFWETSVISIMPWSTLLAFVLLAAAFLGTAWLVRRDRVAVVTWLVAGGGLVAFSYTKLPGQLHHNGALFVVLVLVAWRAMSKTSGSPSPPALSRVLTGLLVVHVLGGLAAVAGDVLLPFSRSEDAADAIATVAPGATLVGAPDYLASPVGAWLDKPVVYPADRRSGTFIVWDDERFCPLQLPARAGCEDEAIRLAQSSAREGDVLIVPRPITSADLEPLGRFDGSVTDEEYYLYRVRPSPPP
ncbi:MAG TPA: hypothetical protein VK988_17400 [Acidimicrobiales bacterium]|nr:hypothetical protein [Acidimicrobiales bacterium]